MLKKEQNKATAKDYQLIRSPIITEKSSLVGKGGSRVVFRVPKTATKDDIRSAVQRVFKVDVTQVRTLNVMGKRKRTMKGYAKRESFKKAYVTLVEGQTINMIEGL